MKAKNIFLTMLRATPQAMKESGETDTYEVTFFTSLGVVQGTPDDELLEAFATVGDKVESDFAEKGVSTENLRSGDVITLKDVTITTLSGTKTTIKSLALFSDQVIGVSLAKPFHSQ